MKPPKIDDVAKRHAYIWVDIEQSLCSIQCAGAMHEGRCVCACRGQHHGQLWIDAKPVAKAEAA